MATTEPTTVVVAQLQATSAGAREQLIKLFESIVEYSRVEEPGVLKYAICTPADDPKDEITVYAIEEYANQSSFEAHLSSPPVLTLLSSFTSTSQNPTLLAKPPIVHTVHWTSAVFTRPNLATHPTPYILFATIDTPSVADTETIAPYGAAVVRFAKESEPDTLFYGDARPKDKREDDKGFIAAVEVYTDKAALDRHFQGEALKAMVAESQKLGGKLTFVGLNKVAGWLAREEARKGAKA